MKIYQKNITNTNTLSVCLPHPPNASNIDTPLPGCLSVISGTDKIARMKILCIQKLHRTDHRLRIRYPYLHHTPLRYRTSNRPPPPDRLSDDLSGTIIVPG